LKILFTPVAILKFYITFEFPWDKKKYTEQQQYFKKCQTKLWIF
jgi:hypothetical protein